MRSTSTYRSALVVPSFAPLRASILAALGLSAAACGGNVTVEPTGGGEVDLCDGAVQIMQANGDYSGFDKCPDGTIHRVEAVSCDVQVPACKGDELNILCTSDADCTDAPNGRCAHVDTSDFGGPTTYCSCAYPCTTDADCASGQACVCAGVVAENSPWPSCAPAACLTNAGCPSGECGISSYATGCGQDIELACRAATDVCRLDSECMAGYQCVTANGTGKWSCETTSCAIGRPLVVEGRSRTAGRAARGDWSSAGSRPETASLDERVRAALAATWREIAAMEHASIGSFSRFSLELLSLGAPPALLLRAHQAAADEVVHAQIAYALAGAYEGAPMGPAPLDMTGVAPSSDVTRIVEALVEEACVGETLGAAEARALAGFVKDPALAAAYDRIAEDEGRHAELGWSTLAWLLRTSGEDVRRAAAEAFERAMVKMQMEPRVASSVVSPEHGLLSPAMLGALRRRALMEVVAPCARTVLGVERAKVLS